MMPKQAPPQPNFDKPQPRGRYPHLLPYERQIWRRFLDTQPVPQFVVAYDVHVGTPAPIKSSLPENYQKMVQHLSTKRIDAVLSFPQEIVILEIKRNAGLTAIGQVLSYNILFTRKYHPTLPVHSAILTDAAQSDMPMLCAAQNVILLDLQDIETKV